MNRSEQNTANPYASFGSVAAQAPREERMAFVRRTYIHLGVAIYAFVAIEWMLFQLIPPETLQRMVGTMLSGYNWLMVLGAFMVVSWVADRWAQSGTSRGMQYAGLFLYVAAEAVIFLPLLAIALAYGGFQVIGTAGLITLVISAGLTAAVFLTGKDFSFLRTALMVGGFAAIGLILCGTLFGFQLGTLFSVAMVVLSAGYILYYTSNVLHHYRTDQYVAAALALFAAVALLFWYILQLVMSFSGRD